MEIYTGFEIEVETTISPPAIYNTYRHSKAKLLDLASNTKHITNTVLQSIKNYHSDETDFCSTLWRLEGDASLLNGAEFISPPEPMDISIKKLFDFFEHIDNSGCITSNRCGLHVNMSTNNKTLNGVDIPTFVTLINQRLLFKLWGHRMKNNQHVRSMQNILKLKQYDIASIYDLQKDISTKIKDIGDLIVDEKYNFVNKRRINGKNYIEIRIIGGKNYHKKKEEIRQTIEHFAKALEQAKKPKQLHERTRKKITSYVNRINYPDNKNMFIPNQYRYRLITDKMFCNELKQLKNIHKYPVDELIELLKEKGIINSYICEHDHTNIRKYFNKCVDYVYSNTIIRNDKKREIYINYINYHYIKYIYNNFSKEEQLSCFLGMTLSKSYGLHLPEDEPKRNLFWMLKLIHGSSPKTKTNFVNGLPLQIINYILKRKVKGFITLAKTRKKFIKNTEKI
jgi:hypothetical protein